MAKIAFSTEFDRHQGPEISDFGPSLTKQEFLDESDVNNIINQYETTGIGPMPSGAEPMFGDFSDPALANYQDSLNIVRGSQELFAALPARVRERFANDPVNLILFVQDPANLKEAHELGLLRPDYKSPSEPPPPQPPKAS